MCVKQMEELSDLMVYKPGVNLPTVKYIKYSM